VANVICWVTAFLALSCTLISVSEEEEEEAKEEGAGEVSPWMTPIGWMVSVMSPSSWCELPPRKASSSVAGSHFL
jgi:hypothetical protein